MCGSKIEGSQVTSRLAAELLRSVISQQRLPLTNQAAALIDAVKTVGGKLILANPVGKFYLMLIVKNACCYVIFIDVFQIQEL